MHVRLMAAVPKAALILRGSSMMQPSYRDLSSGVMKEAIMSVLFCHMLIKSDWVRGLLSQQKKVGLWSISLWSRRPSANIQRGASGGQRRNEEEVREV